LRDWTTSGALPGLAGDFSGGAASALFHYVEI
jgi:hypothetical protein